MRARARGRCWLRAVAVAAPVIVAAAAPAQGQGMLGAEGMQYQRQIVGAGTGRGFAPAGAATDAFVRFDRGDLDEARQALQGQIADLERSGDVRRHAMAVDFDGLILQRQGRMEAARASHAKALQLLEPLPDTDVGRRNLLARSNARINLGTVLFFVGQLEEAARQLEEAVRGLDGAREERGPDFRLARGRAHNNLGLVQQEMGRLADARQSFDRAAAAAGFRPATDDDRMLRAQALNNEARVLGQEDRLDEARAKLQEARGLARDTSRQLLEANVLDSLAEVLLDAEVAPGDRRRVTEEALAALDEAVRLEAVDPSPLVRGMMLINRGRALSRLGRGAEALRALDEAVAVAANLGVPSLQRDAHGARADHLAAAGPAERDRAIKDYAEAIAVLERTQGRALRASERHELRVLRHLYERIVGLLLARGDVASALGYLDRSKSAALRHELIKRDARLREADAEQAVRGAQGLLRQEETLVEQVRQLRLAGREDAAARLEKDLRGLRGRAEAAIAEIQKRYGDRYRDYFSVNPDTLLGLKDSLPPGHLVVTYFVADDGLWLFLVSNPGGLSWRRVPGVRRAELDERVRRYRQLVLQMRGTDVASRGTGSWDSPLLRDLREQTDWLYRRLLEPIEAEWRQAQHLILAPTGLLYYLPFHALGRYDAAKRELRFLVQDKPVSYLTNATLQALGRAPARPRELTVLALGNPTYKHERPPLAQLGSAEKEVEAIRIIFGSRAVALPGPQATLANLRARLARPAARGAPGPARFGILHLATHGVVERDSPADSWLAFEGKARLLAREIPELPLEGTHLATLSACETALAEDRPGADLMSLGRFFSTAGVPSVLVSLWEVDDDATRDLMVRFYETLVKQGATLDKARAIQAAQVALLARPETRHPYFWAAFILIGDWR